MRAMLRGIEVELIWFDQDVLECRFRCANGEFSGTADAYLAHGELQSFAEGLKGFPSTPADSRTFEFGTFDSKCAGGGLSIRFFCRDSPGHPAVELHLRKDVRETQRYEESVSMRIPIEAAGIDSFVFGVKNMGLNVGAKAHLRMAA